MQDFDTLWRFVFEADSQDAAQSAADDVAARIGVTLPPVAAYKQANWWMTDVVVASRGDSLALLLGTELAKAGKLAHKWSLESISELADDGLCFALFNAGPGNRASVDGLVWALLEVWVHQEPVAHDDFSDALDG